MTTVTTHHEIKSVKDLVDLWNTNETFKKMVGPTIMHLRLWISKKNNYYCSDKNNAALYIDNSRITFDEENQIERFLVGIASKIYIESINEYIEYNYSKDGFEFIKQYISNVSHEYPIIGTEYIIKYIIKNNIRLDGLTANCKLHTQNVDDIIKLFELGLNDNNNYYTKNCVTFYQYYDKVLNCEYLTRNNLLLWCLIKSTAFQFNYENLKKIIFDCKTKNIPTVWILPESFKDRDLCHSEVTFKNIITNYAKINTELDFKYYYYVINGEFLIHGHHYGEIPSKNMFDLIDNKLIDINMKVYKLAVNIINYPIQAKKSDDVIKLLNMNVKLFDDNDKPVYYDGATYKYSYDLLKAFYKDNATMLDKIEKIYSVYNTEQSNSKSYFVTLTEVIEEQKIEPLSDDPEIMKLFDSITDQKIKDKLIAYKIKQTMKK